MDYDDDALMIDPYADQDDEKDKEMPFMDEFGNLIDPDDIIDEEVVDEEDAELLVGVATDEETEEELDLSGESEE